MPGKKRKSSVNVSNPPTARRQSRRTKKAVLSYGESESGDAHVVDEFKNGAEEPEHVEELGDEDNEALDDQYADRSDEEVLKKQGWTKKKGKGGIWEMTIELPGIKDPGDIPYEDKRVHPNTLDFLRDLKKNNRREWLKFHDAPYRSALPSFRL